MASMSHICTPSLYIVEEYFKNQVFLIPPYMAQQRKNFYDIFGWKDIMMSRLLDEHNEP